MIRNSDQRLISERVVLSTFVESEYSRDEIINKLQNYKFISSNNNNLYDYFKEIYNFKSSFDFNDLCKFLESKTNSSVLINYLSNEIMPEFSSVSYLEKELEFLYKMNSIDLITGKLKDSITGLQTVDNSLEFNPDEQINLISDQLMNLLNSKSFDKIESFEKIVDSTYEKIIERSKNSNKVTGVSVNMSRLDHITSGFQNQDLVILAARPGAGKTALALNFFLESAKSIRDLSKNEVIVFFSIEMSKEQLMQRLLSREAMVEQNRLRSGFGLSNIEKDQLKIAKEDIKKLKDRLVIIDDPSLTLSGMLARLRQVQKSNKKIRMIILDYLQLLESDKSDKQARISRQEEVANFSKKLKNIARTFNVPLISLAQLSRKVEERKAGDDKPMLSDLRESGAIEQDADIVMFLHHPKSINDSTPIDNTKGTPVVLVIAKHRNGSVGDVNMVFHKPTSTIKEDIVPSYDNI